MHSGYWVEYLEASPTPGAMLTEGDAVAFTVKVRYLLTAADKGVIQMQFSTESRRTGSP